MNRLKDNSSVEPNCLYSSSYLIDQDIGYNNNTVSVAYVNEFKVETSVGSQSAPTSLMTDAEHFNYPHYTPNIDYMQCVQSTDDSFGSSCSSGTKLSYPLTKENVQTSNYIQSKGMSIDSYFQNSNVQIKLNEVDENENSLTEDLRPIRGRGRGGSSGSSGYSCNVRKRHINQENNDNGRNNNGNQSLSLNGSNGRGKHGKTLTRHPFIPSYMDPNNGPHLCVVCRHNASGFHYRVMACEGCKGFFRRTVQNNLMYSCKFNNKCEIQPHNRAQCQECRWRKCLDVGMAKDLVLSDEARRAKKELIAANRAKKLTLDRLSNKGSNEFRDPASPISNEKSVFKISEDDERIIKQIKNAFDVTDSTKSEISLDFQDPNAIHILQCIVEHHVTSLIIKCDIVDDGNIHCAKYNYSQQFNALAIIVTPMLQRVIGFAFLVPKFCELSPNDQIVLLKNACFDIISLRNSVNYDRQSQSLKLQSDFVVTKDVLKLYKLLEPTFVFVNRISSISMNYYEISLMAALALMSCDRMGLRDIGKVESIQDDILRSIDSYMKHISLDNTHRQSELYTTILPELRSTTSWHTQIMINASDTFINNLLSPLKAIYHYREVLRCPPFIESSNSRFIIPNTTTTTINSPMATSPCPKQAHQTYLNFSYVDPPMSSQYSSLDSGRSKPYTNSHLPTNSGQQLHQEHRPSSSVTESFTELLIDSSLSSPSSSDLLKVNRLLLTDKYITQESSSSSTHANYTPVTNHNKATNIDPVYDFSNDLI